MERTRRKLSINTAVGMGLPWKLVKHDTVPFYLHPTMGIGVPKIGIIFISAATRKCRSVDDVKQNPNVWERIAFFNIGANKLIAAGISNVWRIDFKYRLSSSSSFCNTFFGVVKYCRNYSKSKSYFKLSAYNRLNVLW